MKALFVWFLLAPLALAAPKTKASKPKMDPAAAEAALAKLQASWDETRSYQADFTQSVHSKAIILEEEPVQGTLSVIKPNQLKWEDKTTHVTQLLNGNEYWEITENPRRKSRSVTHRPDVSRSLAKTSLAILVGRGKFQDFYKVKLKSENAKEAVLEMVPKTDSNETLIAKIDKNGYVLRSLTTESQDSRVVVEFKNTQRNPELPETLFQYEKQPNDVFQTKKD